MRNARRDHDKVNTNCIIQAKIRPRSGRPNRFSALGHFSRSGHDSGFKTRLKTEKPKKSKPLSANGPLHQSVRVASI